MWGPGKSPAQGHILPATLCLQELKRRTQCCWSITRGARRCAQVPRRVSQAGACALRGIRILAPNVRTLLQPPLPHQPRPCPTLSQRQGPLGEAGRAGLNGRQQGVLIAPSTGLEAELSPDFLSASQACAEMQGLL